MEACVARRAWLTLERALRGRRQRQQEGEEMVARSPPPSSPHPFPPSTPAAIYPTPYEVINIEEEDLDMPVVSDRANIIPAVR